MRNILNSTPTSPSLAPQTAQTSLGSRILEAITGGPSRRFSGHHYTSGDATSSSPILNRRLAFPILALVAALAVVVLVLMPGGPLQAQEVEAIEYAENDTVPVATFTAVDPEGESIFWSLAPGDDMEDFSIENGVLRFKSSPDFEDPKGGNDNNSTTYEVTVQASDGGATPAMEEVTIEVTNVEEPGTVTLSTLQPQVGVAIIATLTDPDNVTADSVSWQWHRGDVEIAGATDGADTIMSSYTPRTGDVGSVLRATAMYEDDEDEDKTAQENSAHAVREAPESNIPPSFPVVPPDTAKDQTREVAENTPAGTNLGAPVVASDPDVLTYSLSAGAESFDINRATGQLITKAKLDYEDANNSTHEYMVTVTATDPFGAPDMSAVTITVTDVNEAPMLTGAASIDHPESNEATVTALDADSAEYTVTDVDDVDDAADLSWLLSGADASKFEITGTNEMRTLAFKANPNYESPGDSGGNNVYEVTLVVTDSKGNSDEQDVTVKVTNVEEDGVVTLSTLQPRVGFPVTATLTDPDNITAGSVSWQWYNDSIDMNDLDQGAIEDATSDTYTPTMDDIGDTLTARATYTDGFVGEDEDDKDATGAATNTVLADTRNKAPVFPDQDTEMDGLQTDQERMIAEDMEDTESGRIIGLPVAAMDEDTNLTYSLGGVDAASFSIQRTDGQLSTKAKLDKEANDTYMVTVTAEDSLNASSTITVTIKVTNIDEMPELEGEAPEEYAENGTGAVATFTAVDPEGESIVWSLVGDDMDEFTIVNGVLRFKSSPDFEDPQGGTNDDNVNYEVTVQASDGGATPAMEVVMIEVTNVDEPGTVMLSTLQPQVDKLITATLTDPDEVTESTVTWQWYRGNSPISGATAGAETATSVYTPMAGDVGSVLRATAMYDDDEDEDKTARENSYRGVRLAPETNTDPVFPDQDLNMMGVQTEQEREVAENTPAGRNLGAPIAASDPGDVLTYSLSGTGAESFDISRATGQLSTKAKLDYEDANNSTHEYMVTVTATDPFGAPDMSAVTITVTDVNEAPMLTGAASIDHPESNEATVTALDADSAEYTVTDVDDVDDAADLSWLLSGADASKFEITGTNEMRTLAFKANPNYESPGDSGGNNVYEVTLVVTDSKGNSDEQDVTVKVTNMEETGMVTLSTLQPRVGFPVTATLADPDNITEGSVSWQWYRGQNINTTNLPETECADAGSDTCSIKDAMSDTYTPAVGDIPDTLNAVATYTDGSPNEDDAKDVVAEAAAHVVLADTRNKAPKFPDQDMEMDGLQTDQERMIAENTDSAMGIGGPVAAMDSITANDGRMTDETLTYSLGGADAASFSIDRGTGMLSTKAKLDKETEDTYTVTVTATDPSGESATVMVTIKITNVDEPPIIMVGGLVISGKTSVDYAENGTDAVETYTASGPDAVSAIWTLSGDDAGDFRISSSGELTFVRAPDYGNPADADMDNIYMVTVMADDGTYMDTREVTVRVTEADGMGTGTLPAGIAKFDTDPEDNAISKGEVIKAIVDYVGGDPTIAKSDVIALIIYYVNNL